jgi:hypothetical protein
VLDRAAEALRDGRRLLALFRLAAVEESLGASAYVASRSPADRGASGLEREWTRVGSELHTFVAGAPAPSLAAIRPAAVRAIAEAAAARARTYYYASLDYGRNTAPQYGLLYLGAALAQRDVASLCRTLSTDTTPAAPPLRPLATELDALEGELLLAYRPPASVERHPEFIPASAAVKEARELDGLGMRHAALLKYVQAAGRVAALRAGAPAPLEPQALAARLREGEERLAGRSAAKVDHSIAQLLLEQARAEAKAAGDRPSPTASAIVTDALPRYFAALEPARPAAAAAPARATVTLVRWPYT